MGVFCWRRMMTSLESQVSLKVGEEIDAQGTDWSLLKAGLFGGSLHQLKTAKTLFDRYISRIPLF